MTAARNAPRVHPARIRWLREGAPASGARYVLYWVQINQRARRNDALAFAIAQADALGLPVVVYQGLRPDYPGANDRIHTFILQGARDLRRELAERGILHLFHLERRRASAAGLIATLARDAALVVTDHFPVFVVPGQSRALANQIERPVAAVEASCIVPAALFPKQEYAARTFRPKLHRLLPEHIAGADEIAPKRPSLGLDIPFPFEGRGLEAEEAAWLDLGAEELGGGDLGAKNLGGRDERIAEWVASCAIDHAIAPSPAFTGGSREAARRLAEFTARKLERYGASRNDPAVDGTSGLSPYLHFGQISALEIALSVLGADGASPRRAREALAGTLAHPRLPAAEFLEQLIVRRELAFNFCETNPHYASIEGLPSWAADTLDAHERDPRPAAYDRETLEWGETEDAVWNAAQEELRMTGVIHNRMRMLWGKKLLEWSRRPADAVATMIDLHDRYALDGRDPSTYANILWCLGLHDRPFGPARPVFGTVRPMSTQVARRSLDLPAYLARIRSAAPASESASRRSGS